MCRELIPRPLLALRSLDLSPARPPAAQISSDESMLDSERVLIQKMNMLIVGILKHDWPAAWPEFIPSIVAASKCVRAPARHNRGH